MNETSLTDSPTLLQVDATPLELNDDYYNVLSDLNPLAARWKNIGFALRLKPDALERIDREHGGDLSACLASMVKEWLKRNYNVERFGKPTWQRLAEAVGDPAGGADKALSKRIAEKHTIVSINRGQAVPSSPQESAVTQAQGTITSLPPTPITNFNYSSPPPTSVHLSKSAAFAHENWQTITAKFADFQTKMCSKLFKNGVDIEEFRLFVINQFPPGDCIPPTPASLNEIFEAITKHGLWNFFHYSPLVRIAAKFGAGDPEMDGWVKTYKKDVKAYRLVTTVEDFIETDLEVADSLPAKRAKYDCCPVEWKTPHIDHTLQHLAEVWEMFSTRFLVPDSPPTALLDRVRRGCFVITWLIPSGLISTQVIERMKTATEFFQQHHIQVVTVGGECVHEKPTQESTDDSIHQGLDKEAFLVQGNQDPIDHMFATFLWNVCTKLVKIGVDVEDFRYFAVTSFPPGDVIPSSPATLTEIFKAITHHHLWDYFHYSPLERIFKTFCAGDPEMETWVQDYEKNFRSYTSKTKIIDYIEPKIDSPIAECNLRYYCSVEWKITFADNTLLYLSQLSEMWEKFSAHYLEPDSPPTSLLKSVCEHKDGMSVTWLVPSYLIPQLIKKVKVNTFFRKHGIWKVIVADQCIYDEQAAVDNTTASLEHCKPTALQPYRFGRFPAITLNNNKVVVTVRNTLAWFTLKSCVGVVSDTIHWGNEERYSSGYFPRVSLNNENMVVEVHACHYKRTVSYCVGKVDVGAKAIDWGNSLEIGNGRAPAVALTDNGRVVVVYENDYGFYKSYCRVGNLDTGNKEIHWVQHVPQPYGHGLELSVAVNNDGTVVEVHRSSSLFHLCYTYGRLEVDNQGTLLGTIDWREPERYSSGFYPFVSLNSDGKVVEVHQSLFFRRLAYRAGITNDKAKTLRLSSSQHHYDLGWAPVVALNDHNQVVEIHETNSAYKGNSLWYKIGSLKDKSDDDIAISLNT